MASQLESTATAELGSELASKAGTNQKSEAKWGFLKNIVNIDSFFSSGAPHSGGLHQKSTSFHGHTTLHETKAPKVAAKIETKKLKPEPEPEKQKEESPDPSEETAAAKDDNPGIKVEDKSKISLSQAVAKTLEAAKKQKAAAKKTTKAQTKKAEKKSLKKKAAPKDEAAKEEAEEGKVEKSLEDEMTDDIMGEDSTKKQSAVQKPEPKEEPAESKEDEDIEQQAAALAVSEMEKQGVDQEADA
mmetsp:Transcript_22369/g.34629  ORF Transcript_22369/g.34629 Transcript_22369/m.34629 type:complete len:244 (+) Transcript_22369:132-863(+)